MNSGNFVSVIARHSNMNGRQVAMCVTHNGDLLDIPVSQLTVEPTKSFVTGRDIRRVRFGFMAQPVEAVEVTDISDLMTDLPGPTISDEHACSTLDDEANSFDAQAATRNLRPSQVEVSTSGRRAPAFGTWQVGDVLQGQTIPRQSLAEMSAAQIAAFFGVADAGPTAPAEDNGGW